MIEELPTLADWDVVLVCWYPHSGGRWFNRGLLSRHPGIVLSEYFTPWLNHSVDAILGLDKTTQVHKARSMKGLREEFDIVVRSVESARRAGLVQYFTDKRAMVTRDAPGRLAAGALPVGSHVGVPDFALLLDILPKLRIIQLIRDPVGCFGSLKTRRELDGDPYHSGASWVQLNAAMRTFFEAPERAAHHRVVRMEDLANDTEGELRRVCDWLGLSFDETMLDGRGEYHGRNEGAEVLSGVTQAETDIIRRITAGEALAYGYIGAPDNRPS